MLVLREGARRLHEVRGKERQLFDSKTAAEEAQTPQNTSVKALTCGEHVETQAGEAGKPRSTQQKSMHRRRDKQISQKD